MWNAHVTVVGNQPPQASPPYLKGETTVTLTPSGVVYGPLVMTIPEIWDPEGDLVTIEGYGMPPTYAANLSAFLSSLVALYTPGGLTDEDLCYAVRNKDVLQDEFSITLRDECGATTEVPAVVTIRVEDKVAPKIVCPAQDKAVECDGEGNLAELQGWLASHAGAWAFDNCCDVTWTNDYNPDKFITTCGNAGYVPVTFTASDCAGNKSSTTATFRIVDTTKPTWAQPMPEDVTVECHQVLPPPEVAAGDICDPNVAVTFTEERVDGPCPYTYTLIRTWRATDACGNAVEKSQRITVRDTTPPVLTVPGDSELGCNPADTSPDATGWATAADNCDPAPLLTYTDSVSTQGCRVTIERTWRATDTCGNTSQKVQRITYIQDTAPPTIHCPGHVWHTSSEPPGSLVWVDFNIGATDNCGSPTVTCVPSGGWFEVGTTTLASTSCTARDACGNETSQECTFWVTVEFVCPPLIARPDFADAPGYVWIPVLANDSGYGLQIVDVSPPTCGNAWISGDGITYTTMGWSPKCPPPSWGMRETFSYTVKDACGNIDQASVTVTITCEICPTSVPPKEEP